MAISVQTNYASLVTQNTLQSNNNMMTKSLERLSTGFRINSAADDAAGLQIANRLEAQNRGMGVASRNAQDAISMLQTVEGSMDEMTNIAFRMQDLATQSANGTASQADRDAMDAEFQSLGSELQSILTNTNFGGQSLLGNGTGNFALGAVSFQIGAGSSETLSVDLQSEVSTLNSFATQSTSRTSQAMQNADADLAQERDNFATGGTTTSLASGVDGTGVTGTYTSYQNLVEAAATADATAVADLALVDGEVTTSLDASITANAGGRFNDTVLGTAVGGDYATIVANHGASGAASIGSQAGANTAIDTMATLINEISSTRSSIGANINRLDHTITNLGNMSENISAAKGRIMDTDFASESAAMSKSQMLMQSGASMLSASKMVPQLAMSLLG
ncbi:MULTISPECIES: flagellin [Vibrio]|uniref:flagellin N-terminal helical domain-containing protein n=1 Tax=Vibrio TaxID=662 RepID=UPI003D119ABE